MPVRLPVQFPKNPNLILLAITVLVAACSAAQPTVVQKMDEQTAVTVTYGATPMVMSLDEPYGQSSQRRYIQIGSFEINRMGTRNYYLWLGISGLGENAMASGGASGLESVQLLLDDQSIDLEVTGWSHGAVGVGEPVYKKLYATSLDAYYPITLEQIQLLANATNPRLRTSGAESIEYVPWYQQALFKKDLDEFLGMVN